VACHVIAMLAKIYKKSPYIVFSSPIYSFLSPSEWQLKGELPKARLWLMVAWPAVGCRRQAGR
jgi:hypothetical protein